MSLRVVEIHPECLYVGRVAVLPSHRKRGIGSLVMRYMEDVARSVNRTRMQIGVRLSLPGNVVFYERLGYRVVEVHDYPGGTDQHAAMVKLL